jgi:hypothetical protein
VSGVSAASFSGSFVAFASADSTDNEPRRAPREIAPESVVLKLKLTSARPETASAPAHALRQIDSGALQARFPPPSVPRRHKRSPNVTAAQSQKPCALRRKKYAVARPSHAPHHGEPDCQTVLPLPSSTDGFAGRSIGYWRL